MEALLLYWLKANVVLALFAATYYALLRRLTFFRLNRAYLLFALGFAAVYPLLPMPALLPAVAAALPLAASSGATAGPAGPAVAPGLSGWQVAGAVYLVGAAGLLLRLLGQLLSLAWVRRRAHLATVLGQAVRVVPGAGGPFSFGRTIFLTSSALADAASLPAALRHEQAHVRQAHTLDVLLLQLATALAWPNPAAWLLRRAALDNLEYLADQAALQTGALARRDYQYLLLRQQAGGVPAPALAFQFSLSTLKNRILMLNQPLSPVRQLGRHLLAAPLVVLLALGYAGARAQTAPVAAAAAKPLPLDALYYLDGQPSTAAAIQELKPAAIGNIDVIQDEAALQRVFGRSSGAGAIIITTRANAQAPAVLAFNKKLGADYPTLGITKAVAAGSRYTEAPAQVNVLVPKALAYITSHYPDSRLSGQVTELTEKATGTVKYRVQLVTGKRPFDVQFTPQGDFVSE
ncbi:MAG: M56 family metallopeptidase [Janthinobacterium lividum]